MSLTALLVLNLVAILAIGLVVWLISLPLRDASIMDVCWGLGFVVLAWTSCLAAGSSNPRCWFLASLTTIWGLRLAGYLTWRKCGQPEDHRYAAFRQRFGQHFWIISLFFVFGLQSVILWVVSWPLAAGAFARLPGNWLDLVGATAWLVGVAFESIGDFQLARFKANPAHRGQVFDRGLWRYTRHPNYFGDFLVWWGLFLIAFAGGAPWWILISPIVMSVLLLRVSGVTLLEKSLAERTAGYRDYASRTSSFFPWPPRR